MPQIVCDVRVIVVGIGDRVFRISLVANQGMLLIGEFFDGFANSANSSDILVVADIVALLVPDVFALGEAISGEILGGCECTFWS